MGLSEARKRANDKWKKSNQEKQRYYSDHSTAKRFINKASEKDLEELLKMIKEKLDEFRRI
jgi:ribosomal protein L12E/L44/L45/RPP1/RPP2